MQFYDKDVVWLVLDSLRYDVAQQMFESGCLPNFTQLLPESGWTQCHAPGNFTFPSHQSFFAGFLPTPVNNPKVQRLFSAEFLGSETTGKDTFTFKEPDVISAFRRLGHKTYCIGGVGFFNKQTALSRVLPDFFDESYWQPEFSVVEQNSTIHQFNLAAQLIKGHPVSERFLMFINVSAIHQPNYFYHNGCKNIFQKDGLKKDNIDSHAAALEYVDQQLPILLSALTGRRIFGIICSDHGTAYGEDGYWGHRHAHPSVMEVPYADFEVDFR